MNTPTEYFGPHAKRWTHPDTGVTLSLNPADYARAVDNWAQLQEERREEELRVEAVTAAWDDKALDAEDVLIVDGGFRVPEHQRYEFEVESSPVTVPPEMAGRYDAIVYGATRGGIKYPEMIDRNQAETKRILAKVNDDLSTFNTLYGGKITSETLYDPAPMPEPIRGIRLRFLSRVEDDMFSVVRPAARHLKSRKITRNAVRLGLVYIIAIIGVMAVTGVIS